MSDNSSSAVLPIFYWSGERNFGDELSAAVVQWVSGYPVRLVESNVPGKLLAIGSILERARNGDIVWGSGVHPSQHDVFWLQPPSKWYKKAQVVQREIEVFAVRGPLSRDALLYRGVECPQVFGDPGILTPLIYPKSRTSKWKFGLIPHFKDKLAVDNPDIHIINVQQSWENVVDEVVQCDCIISSSLHGIIVAEAYGVPALWLRTLSGEGFVKYTDYYAGTGRIPEPKYSLADALAAKPRAVPDFKDLQNDLIASFRADRIARIVTK